MGKPEITGWTTDPNATEEERQHAALYEYGIDGEKLYLRRNGSDVKHYKKAEDWDVWMRWLGMKRVYKPREFHAGSAGENGSYRVHCKTCAIDFIAVNMLPHDAAKLHVESGHQSGISWSDLVE